MVKNLFLVRHDGRLDYTTSVTPEPVRTIKPGKKSGPDGDWVMGPKDAAERSALLRLVGPTIELREAGVKVGAHLVECVAGPFPVRDEPSDDARHPKMTRTVITTPAGEVAWSNLNACYLLPDGRKASSTAGALAMALGL